MTGLESISLALGLGAILVASVAALARFATRSDSSTIPETEEEPAPLLYAHKGEVVTCENGHEVCDVAEDLHLFTHMRANNFIDWRNRDAPVAGDLIDPLCRLCDGRWTRQTRDLGVELHIGDSWRDTSSKVRGVYK